jgi:hypothetical protein
MNKKDSLSADHSLTVECSGKSGQRGIEHTTTQAKHEVEGRLLLDIVIREGAAVLQLLAREDQTLLIRGDTLLVLDLLLNVINSVTGLDIESDGLALN